MLLLLLYNYLYDIIVLLLSGYIHVLYMYICVCHCTIKLRFCEQLGMSVHILVRSVEDVFEVLERSYAYV